MLEVSRHRLRRVCAHAIRVAHTRSLFAPAALVARSVGTAPATLCLVRPSFLESEQRGCRVKKS
jgi:hypothetical protein